MTVLGNLYVESNMVFGNGVEKNRRETLKVQEKKRTPEEERGMRKRGRRKKKRLMEHISPLPSDHCTTSPIPIPATTISDITVPDIDIPATTISDITVPDIDIQGATILDTDVPVFELPSLKPLLSTSLYLLLSNLLTNQGTPLAIRFEINCHYTHPYPSEEV
ncbi:unnamed protein product [Mytilus edulis]|uniref:Uncharacterized protein n=1 Tax=Mytilus edulis TaxID=6550 RepID=A0A8S3UW58_MYTED|nr:unnamed protein product [Mytilus edulis]